MAVSKEVVLHTSALARLDLAGGASGAEAEMNIVRFAAQMDEIVGYIDILESARTEGVEPLFSPITGAASPRTDEAVQRYAREELLQNAPEQNDGFFIVPRVL